ncbi:MAG: hypothetical protein OXT03_03035, partial [Alphaproteobacteria bacterium]|nr:hypothetical protein [Alphaproteobacteria bacterium]
MPNTPIVHNLQRPLIVLFALIGPVAVLVARGLPFMLVALGVFALIEIVWGIVRERVSIRNLKLQKPPAASLALIVFFAYASITVFWSPFPLPTHTRTPHTRTPHTHTHTH